MGHQYIFFRTINSNFLKIRLYAIYIMSQKTFYYDFMKLSGLIVDEGNKDSKIKSLKEFLCHKSLFSFPTFQ